MSKRTSSAKRKEAEQHMVAGEKAYANLKTISGKT